MKYLHLSKSDTSIFRKLIDLFEQVFEGSQTHNNEDLTDEYLHKFLANGNHVVVVAVSENNEVVGGLVAYVLDKFGKESKELYIYDLAVLESQQRQGIGTSLLNEVVQIAKQRNVSVVFVQADAEDVHAVSFYRKIFTNELIAHQFELEIQK